MTRRLALLALLVLLCVTPAGAVSSSFTAVDTSGLELVVRPGDTVTWTTGNTFTATVVIQQFNGGGWTTITSNITTATSGSFRADVCGLVNFPLPGGCQAMTSVRLRFRCTAFTSGTVDTTLNVLAVGSRTVQTIPEATTLTPNSDFMTTYMNTTLTGGTLTIANDVSSTPTDLRAWMLKIKSTNVQTFSWGSMYAGGTNALPSTTTGSSKVDYLSFVYDSTSGKWHFLGSSTGF